MKRFLTSFGIIVLCIFLGAVLVAVAPGAALGLGLAVLVLSSAALVRPLPRLYLGNRIFAACMAFFVGLTITLAGIGAQLEPSQSMQATAVQTNAIIAEAIENSGSKPGGEDDIASENSQADEDLEAIARAKAKASAQAEEEARAVAEKQRRIVEEANRKVEARRAEKAKESQELYLAEIQHAIDQMATLSPANASKDLETITTTLIRFDIWAEVYSKGARYKGIKRIETARQKLRSQAGRKQAQLLPVMRDAYGPIMRQKLWRADGSARTIGTGFRTVEFVAVDFARNANIADTHTEIYHTLMRLRFTRAQYKWFKQAREFSYYTLKPPADGDLVVWNTAGRFSPAT